MATSATEIEIVKTLFREYAAWLTIDLSFQNFDAELAGLPGDYAPPTGRLLLGMLGRHAAGCVALRRLSAEMCEMKRLYVRAEHRGSGVGRALAQAIISEARGIGYARMRLDTLPVMGAAHRLYESLGFREIPAYCHNPIAGTKFLELQLSKLQ